MVELHGEGSATNGATKFSFFLLSNKEENILFVYFALASADWLIIYLFQKSCLKQRR